MRAEGAGSGRIARSGWLQPELRTANWTIASGALAEGHTWPLSVHSRHFDLGHVLNAAVADAIEPAHPGALGTHHAGLWECDLRDDSLIWSGGCYDIFGISRGSDLSREQCLSFYREDSRARLEAIRSDAIRRRQGFTIDIEIRAASVGDLRRVRIIAAPVCADGSVVRLHGLKLIV